jgi:hypothetical protein
LVIKNTHYTLDLILSYIEVEKAWQIKNILSGLTR